MQIKYSKHLKSRLGLRKIEYELAQRIFENAEVKFIDSETGHYIAISRIMMYDKEKDVMVCI